MPPGLRARVAEELRTSPARAARTPIAARRWLAAAALAAAAAALALLVLPRTPREETPIARVEPAPVHEELAEAEDLPVIQVLDVLAELDELEDVGSG